MTEPTEPVATEAPEAVGKKPWWKRWWGIASIVLVALIVIVAVTGSPDEDGEADEPEEVADVEPAPEPEPEPDPDPEPEPQFAGFEPVTHMGQSDDVIGDLGVPDDVPAVLEISHEGGGNFAVWLFNAAGDNFDLAVNTIGAYQGRRPVNLEQVAEGAEITASGPWAITVMPLGDAPTVAPGGEISGTGDDVVTVLPPLDAVTTAHVRHDGDGNFALWVWGDSRELPVNTIGAYDATVRFPRGALVIDVSASGTWTIDLE